MEVQPREIENYLTPDEKCPFPKNKFVGAKHSGVKLLEKTLTLMSECFALGLATTIWDFRFFAITLFGIANS